MAKNRRKYVLGVIFKDGNKRKFYSNEPKDAKKHEIEKAYQRLIKLGQKYQNNNQLRIATLWDNQTGEELIKFV